MTVFFGNSEKHLETLPTFGFGNKNIGEVLSKVSTIIEKMFSYQQYKNLYGFFHMLI